MNRIQKETMDPRIPKIAKILIDSVDTKKGQSILISADVLARPLILEVYKQIIQREAYPVLRLGFDGLSPIYFKYASDEQLKHFPEITAYETKKCSAHIIISAPKDRYELKDTDPKRLSLRSRITSKLHFEELRKPWVGTDYPVEAYAKDAKMSLKEYTDFVFNSCLYDIKPEIKKWQKIEKILNKGSKIRIIGKNTDISFSVKGRKFIGTEEYLRKNVPDGEIYTAPVIESVNGHIQFTYPAIIAGRKVPNVFAEFRNGNLVRLRADKNLDVLKSKLATDKNAAYLGEFGIGINYKIPRFTENLLFDEKIGGTIHLAFGMSYRACGGTNRSASHQDIVKDLRPKFGGGEVWVDNKLLIKDGKFQV
jgi:aminopeptidase